MKHKQEEEESIVSSLDFCVLLLLQHAYIQMSTGWAHEHKGYHTCCPRNLFPTLLLRTTELRSGRSFPIPPKKGILEQAHFTLHYLQGRKQLCQATSSYVNSSTSTWETGHTAFLEVLMCLQASCVSTLKPSNYLSRKNILAQNSQ